MRRRVGEVWEDPGEHAHVILIISSVKGDKRSYIHEFVFLDSAVPRLVGRTDRWTEVKGRDWDQTGTLNRLA